jgi:hypothetical protein
MQGKRIYIRERYIARKPWDGTGERGSRSLAIKKKLYTSESHTYT